MKIFLSRVAYHKMRFFVNGTEGEISGMCKSHLDTDKNIIVDDVIILKQSCTGATTSLDDDAIAKFIYERQKADEELTDWNIWWHSHSTMDVFWSGTDDKTIKDHIGGSPYLISIVTNKAGEYKGRLDVFPKDTSPFGKVLYSTFDLDVEVLDSEEIKEIQDEIDSINKEADEIIKKNTDEINASRNEQTNKLKEEINKKENTEELETLCKKEIQEKVSQKKWNVRFNDRYFSNSFRDQFTGTPSKKNSKWSWIDMEAMTGVTTIEENQYFKEDNERQSILNFGSNLLGQDKYFSC